MSARSITIDAWRAEGALLFGSDALQWKFVCPSCAHVAKAVDWKNAGATEGEIAFSCVGLHATTPEARAAAADAAFNGKSGPCNYIGGGMLRLNPLTVNFPDGTPPASIFEFAK